jgi:hypothetical protein
MLQVQSRRLPGAAATVLAIVSNLVFADQASAHVKWFCAYDVAGQPRGLENVLCPDFEVLTALALAILVTGCVIEGSALGNALLRALDRTTEVIRDIAVAPMRGEPPGARPQPAPLTFPEPDACRLRGR